MVCKKLATDDKLKKGYNAMGFSQGGQFLYVYLVQLILTLVDYNLCNLCNVILRINYLISALCGVVTITEKSCPNYLYSFNHQTRFRNR